MSITIESLLNPVVEEPSSKTHIAKDHEDIYDNSVKRFPRRSNIYLILNNDVPYMKNTPETFVSAIDNNDRLCSSNESRSPVSTDQPTVRVDAESTNLKAKIRHVLDIIDIGSIITELDPKSAY